MTAPVELDPASSVLAYFGSELRRHRVAAGLSQDRLGEVINYTGALVGMVETAKRTPSREFAELCDAALETDGALGRLWPLVNRGSLPSWFRGFVELEATATNIQSFEPQNIPGLYQTEGYARALIQACRLDNVEQRLSARMERQRILDNPTSPLLWAILDEAVLRRPIGGEAVMRDQLARLLDLIEAQRIVLQVLPFETGAHACSDGAMTILGFSEGPDLVYSDNYGSGQLVSQPDEVDRSHYRYDLARATALSPEASAAKIKELVEEP